MRMIRLLKLFVGILSILFLFSAIDASAAWWDKLGKPEYGGTMILREGDLSDMHFDPTSPFGSQHTSYWIDSLFQPNWAVDRDEWAFNMGFTPKEYMTGLLAESWEYTDAKTVTVKIRKGVKWQNKPPVNGREFTAEDVQFSYDWLTGKGDFPATNPFWGGSMASVDRVVATDKYTVEFRLNSTGAMNIYDVIAAQVMRAFPIVPREWVELGPPPAAAPKGGPSKGGDKNGGAPKGDAPVKEMSPLEDWHNAVGTGAWILSELVRGSSFTLTRNPDYYLHDERHPENQLPYLDTWKAVAIPDMATSLAAIRTGKVDMIVQTRGGLSWQQGETLKKSNPEINQTLFPNPGFCLDMRCDTAPFNDIQVRKAMQLALDLKTIAKNYYKGTVDGVTCGVTNPAFKGWVLPFDQWPKELQDEYSYNPEKAKKLLAEAGFPKGFKTHCHASTDDDLQLLEIIKSQFMDIGVNMDIISMDGNAFRPFVQAGKGDQMVFSNGTAMPFGPVPCIRFRESGNTRDNFTQNNDPKYDEMIRKLDNAPTEAEAKQISIDADQYLLRQHWSVQTVATAVIFAWQPWVKGYMGETIIGSAWLSHVPTRLWIDQKAVKR